MTTKRTHLLIGALAIAALAVGRRDSAAEPNLVVHDITGNLHLHQSTPATCDDLNGDVPVTGGRIEIAPPHGVPVTGGQQFVITLGTVVFSPFETHVSCLGHHDDRVYSQLTVQLSGATPFVATPAGAGVYTLSIPKDEVLIYQASILNGNLDTGYQHPRDPVTGTLDLHAGTLQLTVVGSTKVHVDVLGDYDGTLTATLNGVFTPPNRPPVAACQNASVSAGPTCQASPGAGVVDAGTSDPDGDPLSLSLVPPGPFSLGATPVTLTATDPSGAADSCQATLSVVDQTIPTVGCPGDKARDNIRGRCDAFVEAGCASATDNCSVSSVTGTRDDGRALHWLYPVGTTEITWKATDGSGNQSSCTQTITVHDVERPRIRCLGASPDDLWPANHQLVPVTVHLEAFDNCAPPTVKLVSITCNGDGCDAGDIQDAAIGTDDRSFRLRAEADPHGHWGHDGHPRTYTITYSATDATGNTSTDSTTVTVEPPGHGHDDHDHH